MKKIIILSGYDRGDDHNTFQEVGSGVDTFVNLRHIENDVVNIEVIQENVDSGFLGNPVVTREQLIEHWNSSGDNLIITYDTSNSKYYCWDNINKVCDYLFN